MRSKRILGIFLLCIVLCIIVLFLGNFFLRTLFGKNTLYTEFNAIKRSLPQYAAEQITWSGENSLDFPIRLQTKTMKAYKENVGRYEVLSVAFS